MNKNLVHCNPNILPFTIKQYYCEDKMLQGVRVSFSINKVPNFRRSWSNSQWVSGFQSIWWLTYWVWRWPGLAVCTAAWVSCGAVSCGCWPRSSAAACRGACRPPCVFSQPFAKSYITASLSAAQPSNPSMRHSPAPRPRPCGAARIDFGPGQPAHHQSSCCRGTARSRRHGCAGRLCALAKAGGNSGKHRNVRRLGPDKGRGRL
jgi:hypothetical protein